jgi:3-deoxy-manno-octulosonate cytidylyltransferase (CMP-KDO synthetase)
MTAAKNEIRIGTIAARFDDDGPKQGVGSPLDPNCVKVVLDESGRALYFSRSPIPYPRDASGQIDQPSRWFLHLGVYAFRVDALRRVTGGRMLPTALERTESLEQLRWLGAGLSIAVVEVNERSVGIDTPEDYAAFVARYEKMQRGAIV